MDKGEARRARASVRFRSEGTHIGPPVVGPLVQSILCDPTREETKESKKAARRKTRPRTGIAEVLARLMDEDTHILLLDSTLLHASM